MKKNRENLVREFPGEDSGRRSKFPGFPKFPKLLNLLRLSGRLKLGRPGKKWVVVLGAILGLMLILGLIMIIPAKKVLTDINQLQNSSGQLMTGFREKNLLKIKEANERVKSDYLAIEDDLRFYRWLGIVPVVRGYWEDSQHLLNAGEAGLEAVDLVIGGIEPYADIIGFTEEGTGEGTTAEDRINFVVTTIDKIEPQLDQISEKMAVVTDELNQIDISRYPEEIRGKKVRLQLKTLVEFANQAEFLLADGRPVLKQASWLLGEDQPRKYLLLFQNDAELRPTGGFITAYGILEVFKGKVKPLLSEDIYSLDARFGRKIPAPEPIEKYLPKVYYWNLRDMNLSPDFSVSMKTFIENYDQVPAVPKVDAVVAVDTQVLVRLLEVLGPIGVPEWGNFSVEPDSRCGGCPQVIYKLESLITKPVSEVRVSRKAVLAPLMHSILQNAMQSPKDKIAALFNVGLFSVVEKHALFYFFDEEIQKAFESFNMAGRIKDFEGDYFHLNDCNFAGAKSNMFIEQEVEQDISVQSDGSLVKEVTISYKNPAPPSNCNLEKGELCLNGLYRDWVRLYVPQGSQLLDSSGSEVEVTTYDDLGKTVFEAFYGDKYPLRPLGSAKLIFKYKLPFKIEKGENYKMLVQKQPGAKDHLYTVKINGQIEEFELKSDKEIILKY